MLAATGAPAGSPPGDAGQRAVRARGRKRGHVADDEHLGVSGERASGPTMTARRDRAGAQRGASGPADARAPEHRAGSAAARRRSRRLRRRSVRPSRRCEPRPPARASCSRGLAESSAGTAAGAGRPHLQQHHAGLVGADVVEVGPHDVAREIGDRARQLDARRAAADHHEGQQAPPLGGVGGRARPPRGPAGRAAGSSRASSRSLRPGAWAPSRRGRSSWCAAPAATIRWSYGQRGAVGERDRARRQIDAGHLGQQHSTLRWRCSTERIG